MWGTILSALGGAVINGVSSAITSGKKAQAAQDYANKAKQATEQYSGENLNNAMTNAGRNEALQQQKDNGKAQAAIRQNSYNPTKIDMSNFQNAYNQGANVEKSKQQALYNSAMTDAQNELSQANKNADATQAAITGGLNTAGGLSSMAGNIGHFTSDANEKNFEHADIQDTLRQIKSIIYEYKPEAQEELGVDNDVHVGVTAQSMPEEDVVEENGIKMIDKQKLMETLTAGIAEVQREIDELKG